MKLKKRVKKWLNMKSLWGRNKGDEKRKRLRSLLFEKLGEIVQDSRTRFEVVPFHQIKIEDKIGAGGSGQVFKARYKKQHVALKQMYSQLLEQTDLDDLVQECKFLATLGDVEHPGIVRFFGICFDEENTAYLVLEYCPSTVANILQDEKCDREKSTLCYELMETLQILIDVANTMRFLHSAGVVHRDLKPENLLIDQNQNVRICDFGLARHVQSRTRTIRVSKGIGTPAFMAPEILDPDDTSPVDGSKTDVFAFGIVMWSLLFRTKPYYNIPTNLDIVEGVLHRNMRPELPFSESELLGAKFLKRPTSAPSSPMDVQRPMRRISTKPARFFGYDDDGFDSQKRELETRFTSMYRALDIRDRNYHFRVYKNVFVGSEAISAMIRMNIAKNERDALRIGNGLLNAGYFSHVKGKHEFKNEYLFYRFRCDENPSVRNDSIESSKKRESTRSLERRRKGGGNKYKSVTDVLFSAINADKKRVVVASRRRSSTGLVGRTKSFKERTAEILAQSSILLGEDIREGCPITLAAMCRACWDQDPKKRPHFQEIYMELEKLIVRTGLRAWGGRRRRGVRVSRRETPYLSDQVEPLFRPRLSNHEEEKFRDWAALHRSKLTADMQAQLPPLPPKRLRRYSTRPDLPPKTTNRSSLYSLRSSRSNSRPSSLRSGSDKSTDRMSGLRPSSSDKSTTNKNTKAYLRFNDIELFSPLIVSGNELVPSKEQPRIQRRLSPISPGRDIFRQSFEDIVNSTSSPFHRKGVGNEEIDSEAASILGQWRKSGGDESSRLPSKLGQFFQDTHTDITSPPTVPPVPPKDHKPSF